MNLENQMQSLSMSASEISNKEGEIMNHDMCSLPSMNEESLISEASSASSSWLNLIQNKMKMNTNQQPQHAAPAMLAPVPLLTANEAPAASPSLISPATALNPALQSLLSSATNNMAFNPYPLYPPPPPPPVPSMVSNNSLLNGFTFPQYNNNNTAQLNVNQNNNDACAANMALDIRSITVKFLTMYYNTLHSNPSNLKRFYHLDAEIDRSDLEEFGRKTFSDSFHKLAALKNVLFVDIESILYQKSVNNSILIRVNGTMKFAQNVRKTFEQIFFIYKSGEGFWLIQNDIFWLVDCNGNNVEKENHDVDINHDDAANKELQLKTSYKSIALDVDRNLSGKEHHVANNVHDNMVNKRMINKFYHDSSYQQFDNNLAIFIRPIPNHVTHSKLCGILRTNLIKQCNNVPHHIDISIDYIDVNYHKQFAFVYFGNQETLNLALNMNELYINGQKSQIQRKRSHNGPRKFFPKKRKPPMI